MLITIRRHISCHLHCHEYLVFLFSFLKWVHSKYHSLQQLLAWLSAVICNRPLLLNIANLFPPFLFVIVKYEFLIFSGHVGIKHQEIEISPAHKDWCVFWIQLLEVWAKHFVIKTLFEEIHLLLLSHSYISFYTLKHHMTSYIAVATSLSLNLIHPWI